MAISVGGGLLSLFGGVASTAGAVAASTAAFTFSSITAGIIGGAVMGAAIGGLTSAITGGDIGKGILFGAVGGAVMGGVQGFLAPPPSGAEVFAASNVKEGVGGLYAGPTGGSAAGGGGGSGGGFLSKISDEVAGSMVEGGVGLVSGVMGGMGEQEMAEAKMAYDKEEAAKNREFQKEMQKLQAEAAAANKPADHFAEDLAERKRQFDAQLKFDREQFQSTLNEARDKRRRSAATLKSFKVGQREQTGSGGIFDTLLTQNVESMMGVKPEGSSVGSPVGPTGPTNPETSNLVTGNTNAREEYDRTHVNATDPVSTARDTAAEAVDARVEETP